MEQGEVEERTRYETIGTDKVRDDKIQLDSGTGSIWERH